MKHVLIIDDDPLLRDALSAALKKEHIASQTAVDGLDGLTKAKADHPAVMVIDEHMPNMDGQELVDALQQEDWVEDVHLIVFTANTDIELLNKKLRAGVADYLDKSTSSPERIVEIVRGYIGS
jgi:two-component system chemotaxis response regulator CheY